MSLKGASYLVGAYEHPRRVIPDRSVPQIHAEVALGALADAGLTLADVDGYFSASDAPGFGAISMANYLDLKLSYVDNTEMGGASTVALVAHASAAIAAGKCHVALITQAGRPRTGGVRPGGAVAAASDAPEYSFEQRYGMTVAAGYAMVARRHMYEYGLTSRQLAEVKVSAAIYAQYNPNAFLKGLVSIDEVVDSPMIADPLHRLDCCVITDGGGALVVVSPEVKRELARTGVKVLGTGEFPKHTGSSAVDLTYSGARISGPAAFAEAGLSPRDMDYAGLYDSFTITVIQLIEDLGFCGVGEGGQFVSDGALSPGGKLPVNSDGGGLYNNHPGNRGGVTKVIETVRQLRGEAAKEVQVSDCALAVVHGSGGWLATRMGSATLVLGAEDA